MCLAIPMELKERGEHSGLVELKGVRRKVSLMLMPEARVGDHLLIHAGYAIGAVDADEAAETVRLFEELIAAEGGEDPFARALAAQEAQEDRETQRRPHAPGDQAAEDQATDRTDPRDVR